MDDRRLDQQDLAGSNDFLLPWRTVEYNRQPGAPSDDRRPRTDRVCCSTSHRDLYPCALRRSHDNRQKLNFLP
eukprot:scaffold2253_cov286-Chaetoceros_neogracile.AAC.13